MTSLAMIMYLLSAGPRRTLGLGVQPTPEPPAYVAWMEAEGGSKSGVLKRFIYPLARIPNWEDISFDPGEESSNWASASIKRFPMRNHSSLQAFRMGTPVGLVRVTDIQKHEVGTNSLILGAASWHSSNPPMLAVGEGLTVLSGAPNQRPWNVHLSARTERQLSDRLMALAKASLRLKDGVSIDSKAWSWCDAPGGELGLGYFRFQLGDRQWSWTAFVRADKAGSVEVLWSQMGHDEGEFGAPIFEFLDAEDLDGDGIPELMARYFGFEGTSFAIFRFDGHRGGLVYEGSHCGA